MRSLVRTQDGPPVKRRRNPCLFRVFSSFPSAPTRRLSVAESRRKSLSYTTNGVGNGVWICSRVASRNYNAKKPTASEFPASTMHQCHRNIAASPLGTSAPVASPVHLQESTGFDCLTILLGSVTILVAFLGVFAQNYAVQLAKHGEIPDVR